MTISTTRRTVSYHRKLDGILRVSPEGARFLTLWERFRYFFGARP